MALRSNKILLFSLKAAAALICLFLLWPFIAPVYNDILVAATNVLTSSDISILDESQIVLYRYGETGMGGIDAEWLHFGFVLVVSLISATPDLRFRRRAKYLGVAVLAIFVIHVLTLVILAGRRFSGDDSVTVFLLPIGGSLFPALVWGVMCFRNMQASLLSPGAGTRVPQPKKIRRK